MSDQESGTTVANTGTDSSSNSLVRLQLTLWEQYL
jgi:hypothetical protein